MSEFSTDIIYKYINNHIRTINNYGHYKIKEVVIVKIDQVIGFELIVVDYKVSLYKSGLGFVAKNDPFTPNTYSWVDGTITLDLDDAQTKRDLILYQIID